jgi:hypothetical protein
MSLSRLCSLRLVAAASFCAALAVATSAWPDVAYAQAASEAVEEPVFGSQLMTDQERAEHRTLMRGAKTTEEREKMRAEHHQKMVERAKQRGVTLPDTPPMRGMGRGPGAGRGPGPGPK